MEIGNGNDTGNCRMTTPSRSPEDCCAVYVNDAARRECLQQYTLVTGVCRK